MIRIILFHGVMYVYRRICNISSFQYDQDCSFCSCSFDSYVVCTSTAASCACCYLWRCVVGCLQSVQAKVMALRIRIHLALYLLNLSLVLENARLHTKEIYHT